MPGLRDFDFRDFGPDLKQVLKYDRKEVTKNKIFLNYRVPYFRLGLTLIGKELVVSIVYIIYLFIYLGLST